MCSTFFGGYLTEHPRIPHVFGTKFSEGCGDPTRSCETNVCVPLFLYLLLTATSPKIIDVGVNEFDNIEQNNDPPDFSY